MQTQQIYYEDPYKKELTCKIISIEKTENLANIILDKTIFYPEGGGQPSDRGTLKGKNGEVKIEYVRIINGDIIHQGKMIGEIKENEEVRIEIDWNWRYKYMKIHTGGHILHDTIMDLYPELTPVKGSHGKKPFLEYAGTIQENEKETIEKAVNENIKKSLSVITKEVTYDELEKAAKFIPANLPRSKNLRMIKVGEFPAMPDGGVHVKSTSEIEKIWIANMIYENGNTIVRYGVL